MGIPPETLKNRDVFYRAYTDVLVACLRRNTHLPANPEKVDTSKPVPTSRRDTGTFLLRHASSPSVGRSVADFPVGSRSQEEGAHIPAWFGWTLIG